MINLVFYDELIWDHGL